MKLLAPLLLALPLWAQGPTLTVGPMNLELAAPEDGAGLVRIVRDGESWYVDSAESPTLWELSFARAAGAEPVRVDNRTACDGIEFSGDAITWRGVRVDGAPAVDVTVGYQIDGEQLQTTITVENRSERILWDVDFPLFNLRPTPSAPEQTTLVFSRAFGRSWRNPFDGPQGYLVGTMEPYGLSTPGPVQFGTIYDDAGRGLYWATHDGQSYPKRFFYTNDPATDTIRLRIRHPPGGMDQPGNDYEMPYPVILTTYRGDWWDAAMIYRRWALQQRWAAGGPLAERTDVPQWVKDTQVWARGNSVIPEDVHEACLAGYAQRFLTPLAVHWYNWHANDSKSAWANPANWPPREGVIEEFARLREQGVRGLPYVNSLLWDSNLESFTPEVRAATLKGPNGEPEAYEGIEGAVKMCAATAVYQNRMRDTAARLSREMHTSGTYLDQLGHQGNQLCFDPNHGHPVGGGNYGVIGLREMLAETRAAMREIDPEAILVGESQPESFIDVCDVRLNHYNVWPGWVDLWAAVYGDHTLSYGRTIALVGEFAEGAGFTARIAANLVSGVAFGRVWVSGGKNTWDNPELEPKLRYFQKQIAYRDAFQKYLVYGHLQRPVRFARELPRVDLIDQKKRPMQLPAVLSNAFVARDGTMGVVFANLSEELQIIAPEIDLVRSEIKPAERYTMAFAMPYQEQELPIGDCGTVAKPLLRVGPRDTLVVVIRAVE